MADTGKTTDGTQPPVVTLDGVSVSFGPVRALVDASLDLRAGECLGLVGHNGAGKSTFVNTINGRLNPTTGRVLYPSDGAPTGAKAASQRAERAGVRSVFQELSLCPNLTSAENLRVAHRGMARSGWRRKAEALVKTSLDAIFPDHSIDVGMTVGDLPIVERQMVEIAIAFADRDGAAKTVILDEPTSSLDASVARQLLDHIQRFCGDGGAVIFISHMLGEVFDVASRIVVMKDGRVTEDRPVDSFTREGLVDAMGHMVMEDAASGETRRTRDYGPEVVRHESGLRARGGEIVGLAGLAGHGQTDALTDLYMQRSSAWRGSASPSVAFIGGDRARDGIFPLWSIVRNLSVQSLVEKARFALVDTRAEADMTGTWRDRIAIKSQGGGDPILSLSGGNQQKVLFARALASVAPIIVMDDPMRGVDIGTKREVYKMIRAEAENGRTFLWYSTETEEILECDRVFVFRNGVISAELEGGDLTEEKMLRASFELQDAVA